MASVTSIAQAPVPEQRVRSLAPVYIGGALAALVLLALLLGVGIPVTQSALESREQTELLRDDNAMLEAELVELERRRDVIIEQYDAIQDFRQRFPSSPEQETLLTDLQLASYFAGVNIASITTEYPQILPEGSFEDGLAVTPEQILTGGETEEDTQQQQTTIVIPGEEEAEAESPVTPAPGTDVDASDTDAYPLGTIPLTLTATLDGSEVFVDQVGTVYVASPHLGSYAFGGSTGSPRPTLGLARELGVRGLLATYFGAAPAPAAPAEEDPADANTQQEETVEDVADAGEEPAEGEPGAEVDEAIVEPAGDEPVEQTPPPALPRTGSVTALTPDFASPSYINVDPATDSVDELLRAYQPGNAPTTVAVPEQWASANGFLPLSDVSRSAWLIDELRSSPDRAILIRFVSAQGESIVISGQQFIIRDLPPLPEDIFGNLGKTEDVDAPPTDTATGEEGGDA